MISSTLPGIELPRVLDLIHEPRQPGELRFPRPNLFLMGAQTRTLAFGVRSEHLQPHDHEARDAE